MTTNTFSRAVKVAEKDRKYGLPALTFAEAARVLGIEEGALMIWVMQTVKPSQSEWSMWTTTGESARELPESLIRLYLAKQRPTTEALPAAPPVDPAERPPGTSRDAPGRRSGRVAKTQRRVGQ